MMWIYYQNNKEIFFITDLGSPFFPGGPELWHHPLAYSTAGELPGTLQHATLVHPALHPQVPVRSYLWLSGDKGLEQQTNAQMHVSVNIILLNQFFF